MIEKATPKYATRFDDGVLGLGPFGADTLNLNYNLMYQLK